MIVIRPSNPNPIHLPFAYNAPERHKMTLEELGWGIFKLNEPRWRWPKTDNTTTQKLRWTEVDKRHKDTRTNTYIDTKIERQKNINTKLNQDEARWTKVN